MIRGETSHYDFVAGECARGIQDVQLADGVPVIFGVLTTEDREQALDRSEGPGGHNVGEEGAHTAVEMVHLAARCATDADRSGGSRALAVATDSHRRQHRRARVGRRTGATWRWRRPSRR